MEEKIQPYCKFNDQTERCIFNTDPSAVQDDSVCYKTDKGRCAVNKQKNKKKKMIIKKK